VSDHKVVVVPAFQLVTPYRGANPGDHFIIFSVRGSVTNSNKAEENEGSKNFNVEIGHL